MTTGDGRRLRIEQHGSGQPIVVFESGWVRRATCGARSSTDSDPGSTHFVPFTEPDLIATEIRRILDGRPD